MKKIVFIEAPAPWLVRPRAQVPLGPLYLATILNQNGFRAELFRPNDILDINLALDADVICLSGTTLEYPVNVDCARHIKSRNADIVIFLGGPHSTAVPGECIEAGVFDAVCVGEGEEKILEMLRDLEAGKLRHVYTSTGYVDVNRIPIPDRTLIPGAHGGDIFAGGKNYHGPGNENFITSRGCPYNCAYCASKTMWKRRVRFRTVDNIARELEHINQTSAIKQLRIGDDNLISRPINDLRAVCELFKTHGFVWRCSARAAGLTKEICKALYDGGCREISVGIESGDQRVLDFLNKKTTVEAMARGCEEAKQAGIAVRVLLMTGTPGERLNTPEINRDYLKTLNYDLVTLSTFIPLPGTDVWKRPEVYHCRILTNNYRKYNKDYMVFKNNKVRPRKYVPIIHNRLLSIEQQRDNVARMEQYVRETGKYNTG